MEPLQSASGENVYEPSAFTVKVPLPAISSEALAEALVR